MSRRTIIAVTLFAGLMLSSSLHAADLPVTPDFKSHVLPIFEAKCVRCHGDKRRGGKLDMRTVDALRIGGASGPAFEPGNAQKSLLIELIHYNEMPPRKEQPRVTPEELKLLKAWIDGMKK